MKKFKLTRVMQYTETLELDAESWAEAILAFEDGTEFDRVHDDASIEETMEFLEYIGLGENDEHRAD